jgi:uncharacterized protein YrrD
MLRTLKKLRKAMVVSNDQQSVGEVVDFYFDDQNWHIRYLVINTGSWLNEKLVLISPIAITSYGFEGFNIYTNLTREQIEAAPDVDKDKPISRIFEERYASYFGWEPYWTTASAVWYPVENETNLLSRMKVRKEEQEKETSDKHLRSFAEILGYNIKAKDNEFGHVEDLIFDNENYRISHLIVDTINFWPSTSVLLPIQKVTAINWVERVFETSMTQQQIVDSKEYQPVDFIDRTTKKQREKNEPMA